MGNAQACQERAPWWSIASAAVSPWRGAAGKRQDRPSPSLFPAAAPAPPAAPASPSERRGLRAGLIYRLRVLVRPPVTLGVKALVIDAAQNVILVRHTYTRGWHLPGGAVDPGESAHEAAVREVREETGCALSEPGRLVSLYFNEALGGRDHVALYVFSLPTRIAPSALRAQALEIAEVGVFPARALPGDASPSVGRRIEEIFSGAPVAKVW